MKTLHLKDLIAPISIDDFLTSHWPHKPLFIPANAAKIENLLSLPQLQSLENLIAARTTKVRACLPDFDDEYSSIMVETSDAMKVYQNSMTLVFDSMQKQSPEIAESLKQITQDLGLVIGSYDHNLCQARSIAYATPAWCGTRLHFDANANFIIQISGTKKWTLAVNNSVVHPTERFTTGSLEMPLALEKQCHAELLHEAPEDAVEYLMEPGSVLFVPRGVWHETTTEEDSLSLNFTFSQPSWADVFSKSIHAYLLNSSEWRALCQGIGSSEESQQIQAKAQFQKMILTLAADLQRTSAAELLTEGEFINENDIDEPTDVF
jgi:50S ribosomal protein L16 3-hydroxylase